MGDEWKPIVTSASDSGGDNDETEAMDKNLSAIWALMIGTTTISDDPEWPGFDPRWN